MLTAVCWRPAESGWVTVEGEFNAIMAVVMPCRSDRSDSGLVRDHRLRSLYLLLHLTQTLAMFSGK